MAGGAALGRAHLRVARPSDDLEAVVRFYRDGLGLDTLYECNDHDGFDGVMLGREGAGYHLEFTRKRGHRAGKAPTEDNLLVFYLPDRAEWEQAVEDSNDTATGQCQLSTPTGTSTARRSRTRTATGASFRTPSGGSENLAWCRRGRSRMTSDLARLERDWFGQQAWRCRLEWGRRGAAAAAARGDVLVVVDTLTFSTVVATALHGGVTVYPCLPGEQERLAQEVGAEAAVSRQDVPQGGRFSLSPATFLGSEPGARVVLGSPNGAACCVLAKGAPGVVAGSLVNAQATARFVSDRLAGGDQAVTVLACGERWLTPVGGEDLRFAIEDWLAAGAILSYLALDKSPEAQVCEAAFRGVRDRLEDVLLNCGGGVELREKGYEGDVLHAARMDLYGIVPLLLEGRFVNAAGPARGHDAGKVKQWTRS